MNTRQFYAKQEHIQSHWNYLDKERRERLFQRFTDRLEALFDSLHLTCQCSRCHAVMTRDELDDHGGCIDCGSYSVLLPDGGYNHPMTPGQRRLANYVEAFER